MEALRLSSALRRASPPWLIDVVLAYTTVAAFFDADRVGYAAVAEFISGLSVSAEQDGTVGGNRHRIPCCYEVQLDLDRVAEHTRLSADEVIRLHTETEYTGYAIGFCPGFPYLGYLPPMLCGVPRLPSPRLRVEAGPAGFAGRTGGDFT